MTRLLKILVLLICMSAVTGCVMQNTIEAGGGFFDSNFQENK